MFDTIAPRYDLMNSLMTFGLDNNWRDRTVRALLLAPKARILDLGCGTAGLSRRARRLGMVSLGVDLSLGMLRAAPPRSGPLVQADALVLPIATASLEGIVSGFALRNFSDLHAAFAEMARVLGPVGRISLLEVLPPAGGLYGAGHRLWFEKVVPALGGLISDRRAYRYLPASLVYLPAPDVLASMLEDAGFRDVRQQKLLGVAQIVTATRTAPFRDRRRARAAEKVTE